MRFIVTLAALLVASLAFAEEPKPKIKIGKDTTYVDGPLDKDGYVDYEAAANKLLKGKTTPETNAAVLLAQCFGSRPEGREMPKEFYAALGIGEPTDDSAAMILDYVFFRKDFQGPGRVQFTALHERLLKEPWKAAESPRHVAFLEANEPALKLALAATLCPDYFFPQIAVRGKERPTLVGAIHIGALEVRRLGDLLAIRAMRSLGEGRVEDAFADALAMHRLVRLAAGNRILVEWLFPTKTAWLAHETTRTILLRGQPTAKQAMAFRIALAKLPPHPAPADAIDLGERLSLLEILSNVHREGFAAIGDRNPPEGEAARVKTALDGETALRALNARFDATVAMMRAASRADYERRRDELGVEAAKSKPVKLDDLRRRLAEAKDPAAIREEWSRDCAAMLYEFGNAQRSALRMMDDYHRLLQEHRTAMIGFALVAYHADEKKYPDALADLVPKYLEAVPEDVFTGKPMLYAKTEKGCVAYSVGLNGKDDGGKLTTDDPPGDDLGVRMGK